MEKISVIIPTYNRSKQIKKSIESVLRQSYADFEVLIVDDASTDDTQAVVEAIPDKRIRYIKLETNQGAAGARNEGVRQAQGSIIAFQDSDDVWRPEKLERQLAYWQAHPEYAMIYCSYRKYMQYQESFDVPNVNWVGELEGSLFSWIAQRNSVGAPTMLVKKDCFLEVGGFATDFSALEDWDFVLRFSAIYLIGYVDEILVDSYESPDGISSGVAAYFEGRCRMIVKNRELLLREGVFDAAVQNLFARAEQRGLLKEVKEMLMLYLSRGV